MEYPGIEPGVPEGGGFTVHCITIDASTPLLAEASGFEPNLTDSKSVVLTGLHYAPTNLVDVVRFELTKPCGNRVTAGSDTPTSTAHPKY